MSNLVLHAKRELAILGYTGEEPAGDPNRWMHDHIMKMVETFADECHSGSSASYAIHVLDKVLQFQNVTPLTDDPQDWCEVGPEVWQCRRRSDAFSDDGGKTYYLLDECRRGWRAKLFGRRKMHKSEKAAK